MRTKRVGASVRRAVAAAVLVAAGVGAVPSSAAAQEVETLRFYIVPKTEGRLPGSVKPKYVPAPYYAMDYGLEDTYLVGCEVTDAEHASISGNIDVISIPADLDGAIGLTAVDAIKTRLQSLRVPNDWIVVGITYRQVIGMVGRIFQISQRYQFISGGSTPFDNASGGKTSLTARMNQIPQSVRNNLQATADSMGLSMAGVTNTSTMSDALKILANQIPPFSLAGESF